MIPFSCLRTCPHSLVAVERYIPWHLLGSDCLPFMHRVRMTAMMDLVPSFTATVPRKKNGPTNKRSSSPASLDCHSLQASLKRIRLSCSPGELRLQRDLSALGHFGWQEQQDCTSTTSTTATNQRGDIPTHPPKWRQANAELVLLDPLRLKLTCVDVAVTASNDMNDDDDETTWSTTGSHTGSCSSSTTTTTTTLWIQIPRMYPHRPPVISRADQSPTLFVVRDSPLGSVKDPVIPSPRMQEQSGDLGEEPRPIAVMDWSPVRQIGDLLSFLLEQLSTTSSWSTSISSSPRFMMENHVSSRALAGRTFSSSSNLSSSTQTTTGPLSMISNPFSIPPQRHPQSPPPDCLFILVEDEHKMDEVTMVDDSTDAAAAAAVTAVASDDDDPLQEFFLAPNRFDMGYGRYHDILANSSSSSSLQSLQQHRPQQQQQERLSEQSQRADPHAMEL